MHLALLVTNTDESDFAQRHPKDDVKFPVMIQAVRPEWKISPFIVKDDQFPDRLDPFDGIMITGSPASVHDDAPWIARLLDLIRSAHRRGIPIFGACFGHQAIALALGGTVGKNDGGYVHGRVPNHITRRQPWMAALPDDFALYGSHVEQVTTLPEMATPIAASTDCAIAGFVIGSTIYTTQHHPEMTPGFIAALTDEMSEYLGADVTARARASLSAPADSTAYAETIAQFFQQAAAG
jgi:GMP synthase-like glutamine amidotransferase